MDLTQFQQFTDTLQHTLRVDDRVRALVGIGSLAQPERGVIVVNGDGCMLMNLGSLVTIANHPTNLYLIIIDNGQYEVTGGQPTAGAGHTDFAGLARAAGIQRAYSFDNVETWRAGAAEALSDLVDERLHKSIREKLLRAVQVEAQGVDWRQIYFGRNGT